MKKKAKNEEQEEGGKKMKSRTEEIKKNAKIGEGEKIWRKKYL